MRLEHHLVGGYVRYISPYIIIIIAFYELRQKYYTNLWKFQLICVVNEKIVNMHSGRL